MGSNVFKSLVMSFILIIVLSTFVSAQTQHQNFQIPDKINSNTIVTDTDLMLPRILVDEEFDDWKNIPNLALNNPDTVPERVLKIVNDRDFLYMYFETDRIISLQNNSSLILFIDSDNNSKTGKLVNGIGADIEFRFGEREGTLYRKNQKDTIGVGDLFLIISPTFWSDKYEITMNLKSLSDGKLPLTNKKIRLLIKDLASGKSLPDFEGGALYTIGNYNFSPLSPFSITKPCDDCIRILSQNVEFSSFFREDRKEAYLRMYKTIQPDIIGFSELYPDYKLEDVINRLEKILPSPQGKSWKAKRTADNVLATRFSFKDHRPTGSFGNGAFLLDLRPRYNSDMLVIVAHPECCDNDSSRQDEVDAIAAFIRDSKATGVPFNLFDKTPILVVGDMNFVGDPKQVNTLIEGNIIQENMYGEDYIPDWDGSFFEDAKPLSSNLPHTFTHTGSGEPGTYSYGRLDYMIFSGSVMELANSFVVYTPAMSQELLTKYNMRKDDSEIASDHLPVICDFRLRVEQVESSIYALRQNDQDGIPLNMNADRAITGIVTASKEFGNTGIVFLQDHQAAMVVDFDDISKKIETGDSVTISGNVSQRSGLTMLMYDSLTSQLVTHKKTEVPQPRVVTINDIKEQEWNNRELLEGRLIRIENVNILSSGYFNSGCVYKFTDGRDTLEFKINSTIDLVNTPIPVEKISMTGCLVQNKSSYPYDQAYFLYPRSRDDVTIIRGIEHLPIISLRQNDSQGIPIYKDSVKTVSGIVTATNQFGRNGPAIIQDNEAGIALYGSAYVSKLNLGDSVTVTGPLVIYRGLTEYTYDAEISEIKIHKNVAVPKPQVVTISDIVNQDWNTVELLESKLVMVKNVKFLDKRKIESYRNYTITDGLHNMEMRIGRAGRWNGKNIPTEYVSVIGIVSQNKSSAPFQGGYQLLPRSADDIIIGN